MHAFKDSKARSWVIRIDINAIRRVKAATGFNLSTLADGEAKNPLQPLADFIKEDVVRFAETLLAVLQPDLDTRQVKPEDFIEALDGDALWGAGQAFARAYVDFFHQVAARPSLHKVLDKSNELTAKVLERAAVAVDAINVDREVERIAKSLNGSSGTTPASSESTPAPSLSAN